MLKLLMQAVGLLAFGLCLVALLAVPALAFQHTGWMQWPATLAGELILLRFGLVPFSDWLQREGWL